MATSEIRQKDRQGVAPQHILYVPAKIMQLLVTEGLHSTCKVYADTQNITCCMIKDRVFLDECIDRDLAFLKSILNSMH